MQELKKKMKNATSAESSQNENVISVKFGAIDHSIAHPASKHYPEKLESDPLADLLEEAGEADVDEVEDNYIHAHQKPIEPIVSFQDSTRDLAASALKTLARLKEDSKRLRYYLDELNID